MRLLGVLAATALVVTAARADPVPADSQQPASPPSDADCPAKPPNALIGGAWTLQHENDAFVPAGLVSTDHYYTSGQRISWVSPCIPHHWFLKPVIALTSRKGDSDLRWGWEIGQNIFTPQNIHTPTPDPKDRPYAGWLYVGGTVVSRSPGHSPSLAEQNTVELLLGVVGPSALGGNAQNFVHSVRGIPFALGWSHQLKDEPAVLIVREDRWGPIALAKPDPDTGLEIDFTPTTTLELGNVQTSAAVGGGFRLGWGLVPDFGPPRMRPGPSAVSYFEGQGASAYWFLNAEGRVVAHDIFLDGNTFRPSPSVRRIPLGWEMETGLVFRVWGARISYALVERSLEFRGQKTPDQFASIALTVIPSGFPLFRR